MSIHYEWYNENDGIMLVKVEGEWDWESFYPIHREYSTIAGKLGKRVDFIFDFGEARLVIPESVFANFKNLTKIANELIPLWGITVFVFPSALFTTIVGTFSRLYPGFSTHYRMADTMEKALNIITEEREKGKA